MKKATVTKKWHEYLDWRHYALFGLFLVILFSLFILSFAGSDDEEPVNKQAEEAVVVPTPEKTMTTTSSASNVSTIREDALVKLVVDIMPVMMILGFAGVLLLNFFGRW